MGKFKDLTGETFYRLKVLFRHSKNNSLNKIQWICECECGANVLVTGESLKSGNTKSCGCYLKDVAIKNGKERRTHGLSKSDEYKIWSRMKARCTNPKYSDFEDYGGRGIQVCKEWLDSFEIFYSDMGPRPSKIHSIDRINNDGDYEPGNCRWATTEEQVNNKRNNDMHLFNGELLSLSQIAKLTGIPQPTLWSRLNRMKLTIDEAVKWKVYNHKK